MKGYIYISGGGADPNLRNNLNDPIFSRVPTLGACMPNIRRIVQRGDWIFVVSGKTPTVQQYVVGGFRVREKIDALTAHARFPGNRLAQSPDGKLVGNVICDENGDQHELDRHAADTYRRRVENYIVGSNPISLQSDAEVELGRQQTLRKLSEVFGRPGANRVFDVLGRMRKLDERQIAQVIDWLEGIKANAR